MCSEVAAALPGWLLSAPGVHRVGSCPRATVLFQLGDPAASVFYLESGLVKVVRKTTDGREVLVRVAGTGDIVGSNSVMAATPRRGTAVTLCESAVMEIPAEAFLSFGDYGLAGWEWLMRVMLRRLIEMERRIEVVSSCRVEQRIEILLCEMAMNLVGCPSGGPAVIPLTQIDMAHLVGATRETTSSILNDMQKRGLIELGRGFLRIPSLALLAEAAGIADGVVRQRQAL